MRLRPVLALSLWLVVGTILPTGAQLPPRQALGAPRCDSVTGTTTADQSNEHAIVATVTRVDARRGTLEFTTAAGSFALTTTPAEIDGFRVGDQLLICLHEDMSGDQGRLAEQSPPAIRQTP